MQRKIDLVRAMRIFMAVVEARSFSGASRKLNLATSAVSKSVSDLEDYYDCKLLYRNTRAMHLTFEGERFLAEFKQILNQLDELKTGLDARQRKIAGKLRISSPENAQGLGMDKKICAFKRQYPDVSVSWLQQNRRASIVDEGIDVAIRVGKLTDSNLIARQIARVDNLIVASPAYLQRYGRPEHPRELVDYPCIIEVSTQSPWRWEYLDNSEQHYVNISGGLELDKGETVAYFAAQGHGIARLPQFMLQSYLDSGDLVPILEEYWTEPLEISLVYPHNRLSNPALNAFIEFIR